jgi:recombination protein RecR
MDVIHRLSQALRCLPGIGPKSAQRMVYHLLQHQRARGLDLAACLQEAMHKVVHCKRCNNFTEMELCALCQDSKRDLKQVCVVETPADIYAIEQSRVYSGSYFVLMGKISPLDGLGAEDIHLPRLYELVIQEEISEVILALSPSMEGQITSQFICELFHKKPIKISQLAHGIPSGGELEFLDGLTIGNALRNRAVVHE